MSERKTLCVTKTETLTLDGLSARWPVLTLWTGTREVPHAQSMAMHSDTLIALRDLLNEACPGYTPKQTLVDVLEKATNKQLVANLLIDLKTLLKIIEAGLCCKVGPTTIKTLINLLEKKDA